MKNREAIERFTSPYSKGVSSFDSRLSNRYIYSKMITLRARLLSQEHKKRQAISLFNYQTLDCIALETVPLSECPLPIPIGCEVKRSTCKIPSILIGRDEEIIRSLTDVSGRIILDKTTPQSVKYKSGLKYTSNSSNFYIENHYIYVVTPNVLMSYIKMTALFVNPIEAELFASCGEEAQSCVSYLDLYFPMDDDLFDGMVEMAYDELVGNFTKKQADDNNNRKDDVQ